MSQVRVGLQWINLANGTTRASGASARLELVKQVRSALQTVSQALWLAAGAEAVSQLVAALPFQTQRTERRLLVLAAVDGAVVNLLRAHFRIVVAREKSLSLLPDDELLEAIEAGDDREELIIGGQVTPTSVLLYRANLTPLTVPRQWFIERPASPRPDFRRLSITDGGQTVCLGNYEVASSALLYELDDSYRARAKRRARERDRSLGGAIRRLRLQRGLTQDEFPDVSSKEIRRIESGAVTRPHASTLKAIASRLGVTVEQLPTY